MENFLYRFIGDYSSFGMGNGMSLPPENQYTIFFVQTSTLTPSMHQKFAEHGKFCMQNNYVLIKTLVE